MKILTAVDSFKGSLSSSEINSIISQELRDKGLEVIEKPLADGGEGTIDALIYAGNAEKIECIVTSGSGNKIKSYYAMMNDSTAVIEIAQICGLPMTSPDINNPMHATTYGVGEAMLHAINKDAKRIVITLGGSSTNDMGIGMLQAIGVTISKEIQQPISLDAKSLEDIKHIDFSTCLISTKNIPISVITDVQNPLFGKNGATFVFGPQKGMTHENCLKVEKEIKRLCSITPILEKCQHIPGSGAAGGLGVACLSLGAQIYEGAEWFMDAFRIKEAIQEVDTIITGEGKLDSQTLSGKAPVHIAHYAKKFNKPVIAISGSLDTEILPKFYESGIKICLSIIPGLLSLEQAMSPSQTQKNIAYISQQISSFLTWRKYSY